MQMLNHKDFSRFVLHTGDVIYLVGSSEYYYKNFIKPYREFIVGGEHPKEIDYDKMVFNKPFLPVLGNHDYYDLPFIYGLMAQTALPLRRLLQSKLDIDIGWHGSHQGKAYAQAFMDYLKGFEDENDLIRHLDRHYTAKTNSGRCLYYEPGSFTRLPNRYYSFQSGGIDFFALDSNTFNSPSPLSKDIAGLEKRRQLEQNRDRLEREKLSYIEESTTLNSSNSEQLDDLRTKIEQLDELRNDIDKQLAADETTVVDTEQLDWFANSLIESWQNPDIRGRVVYFHHPPYVTEATKWHQAQTMAPVMAGVNMVNAPVLARERGMDVAETAHDRPSEYQTLVRVTVETEGRSRSVAGTLFAGTRPRLVEIKNIPVEAEFGRHMLYVTNQDKPGFIGRFGDTLAGAGLNIATFHLGRASAGGDAICLVSLDEPMPEDVLAVVRTLPLVVQATSLSF